jgi:hypothetical protein
MEEKPSPKKFKILSVLLFVFLLLAIAVIVFLFKNQSINYNITLPFSEEGFNIEFSYGEQKSLANHDFFDKVKNQFITERADFIEADLSKMILRVYKNGEMSYEVPILTKGREGSWWETPAGLYKINTKTKNHFSSIGHVWMPWAMQFQGNFFIHGETYYDDGTPTASQYSGGCIRLKTEYAEKVYDLVSIGTPLLVFEEGFNSDNFVYESKNKFEIDSPSYLVADLKNNHIFAQESSALAFEIGNATKLMTALIATEYINLDKYATTPKTALIGSENPRLFEGSQYTIYQLLFPLLLENSNEAAETIARNYGRDAFVKQMNAKAKSIGMSHTIFVDPTGVASENVSTAEDLFMLSKYIYNNRSFIFDITSENVNTKIYGFNGFVDLKNLNDFKDNEYFYGGQKGLTVLKVPVNDSFRPITFITLGTASTTESGQVLIENVLKDLSI